MSIFKEKREAQEAPKEIYLVKRCLDQTMFFSAEGDMAEDAGYVVAVSLSKEEVETYVIVNEMFLGEGEYFEVERKTIGIKPEKLIMPMTVPFLGDGLICDGQDDGYSAVPDHEIIDEDLFDPYHQALYL